MPTDEKENAAGRFFNGFAATFDTFYDDKRSHAMRWLDARFRRDVLIRYELTFKRLGALDGKRVLDIGCGSGVYVQTALQQGARHVVAIDAAPSMLNLARARLTQAGLLTKVTFVHDVFPGPELPQAEHAIVMGVMDYVTDALDFLRTLRPLVLEAAAVSFPSRHWLRSPIRALRYRLRYCPVRFYDEAEILTLTRLAGFRSVEIVKIAGAGQDYHALLRA